MSIRDGKPIKRTQLPLTQVVLDTSVQIMPQNAKTMPTTEQLAPGC